MVKVSVNFKAKNLANHLTWKQAKVINLLVCLCDLFICVLLQQTTFTANWWLHPHSQFFTQSKEGYKYEARTEPQTPMKQNKQEQHAKKKKMKQRPFWYAVLTQHPTVWQRLSWTHQGSHRKLGQWHVCELSQCTVGHCGVSATHSLIIAFIRSMYSMTLWSLSFALWNTNTHTHSLSLSLTYTHSHTHTHSCTHTQRAQSTERERGDN